jgi:hypothetical protein
MARVIGGGDRKSSEIEDEPPSLEKSKAGVAEVAFSEAGGAAVAAILHLLRLASAELVLLRGLDITSFEAAARKKIDEFTSPTTNPHARDAGLAFAHQMLEQILVQIRAQAELKKRLGPSDEKPVADSQSLPPQSKLLN